MPNNRRKQQRQHPNHNVYLLVSDGGVFWLVRFSQSGNPIVAEYSEIETSTQALMQTAVWALKDRDRDHAYRVYIGDILMADRGVEENIDETAELKKRLNTDPGWLNRFDKYPLNETRRTA